MSNKKKLGFFITILFSVGVIISLLYYLQKYYIETQIVFVENQFVFYIIFVAIVTLCFVYLIHLVNNLNKEVHELKSIISSYHYGTLEALDNTTEVVLDTHKMLKDKVDKEDE